MSEAVFMESVKRGDFATVAQVLRDQPELVSSSGEHARTPLHWAAGSSVRDVRFDATPEDWALEGGHAKLARLLRRRGQSA